MSDYTCPFVFGNNPVMQRKLTRVWEVVAREAKESGLVVSLLATPAGAVEKLSLPWYEKSARTLTVDFSSMRDPSELLRDLMLGLGLHFKRDAHQDGSEKSFVRWLSAGHLWAESFEHSLDWEESLARTLDATAPPSDAAKPPRPREPKTHPLHCSAFLKGWRRCRVMRKKGTAFCHHHQGKKRNLWSFSDILEDCIDEHRQKTKSEVSDDDK